MHVQGLIMKKLWYRSIKTNIILDLRSVFWTVQDNQPLRIPLKLNSSYDISSTEENNMAQFSNRKLKLLIFVPVLLEALRKIIDARQFGD